MRTHTLVLTVALYGDLESPRQGVNRFVILDLY
jgi:hypothetical protein